MKRLLRYRLLYVIISIFCALNAVVFVLVGVVKAVHGYVSLVRLLAGEESETVGLFLLQSLDSFLVGLVLLIFAFGIYRIFVSHSPQEGLPPWLHEVNNLRDLKLMLWEAIMVILLVFSVSYIHSHKHEVGWKFLVIPGIILLAAISYYLMKKAAK